MSVSVGSESSAERYCPTCERTFASGDHCPHDGARLVKLAKHDLIGRELDGRYTIADKLGAGAMGTVYSAIQHASARTVAIKVLAPGLVTDQVTVKRFLREAKLASKLAHPNVIAVLDLGQTEDGLFYLVMEIAVGQTLDRVIAAKGALDPARVVRIGVQILDGLDAAHAMQIVHRDLKPSNVMLLADTDDAIKLLDFGLAKSLLPDVHTATMTNAGALLGTPAFMPPELVTGQRADERADLYSLGCVLYAAVTGEPPFVASTVHELIAMHASEPVPPMVGVPGGLASVIHKLLEKPPERRYQTAAKAREALEVSLGGAPSQPADPTLVNPATATVLGWAGTAAVRPARRVGAPAATPADPPAAKPADPPAPRIPSAPRRSLWPWIVLAVVIAAAAGIALSFI